MSRMTPIRSYADVMDPRAMHRNGMHKGLFNDGCTMCHRLDRVTSTKKERGGSRDCHTTAIEWLTSLRPHRFPLKRAIETLGNLRNASSVTAPRVGTLTTLLVMRDSFHSFVHGGGLPRLGVRMHPTTTYIVVAKMESDTPLIFHGEKRELMSAFACAIADGFASKRHELLQKLYSRLDLEESVFVEEANRSRVLVMYFYIPPFAKWESVAYMINYGAVVVNGDTDELKDDEQDGTLDSSYPVKLIGSGSVELRCDEVDTLLERRIFAENARAYDTAATDDGGCHRCAQLATLVTTLQAQRNDLTREVEGYAGATPYSPFNSGMNKLYTPVERLVPNALLVTLQVELRDAEVEMTSSHERAVRAEAELELLREEDTDKRKLMSTVQELQRLSGVVKKERRTEKESFSTLRNSAKRENEQLQFKLAATLEELSATKVELSGVRRANSALCSDNERMNRELELTHTTNVAHDQRHLASQETATKSTSTYTDIKSGSVDMEPCLMERVDLISELRRELDTARKQIGQQIGQQIDTPEPEVSRLESTSNMCYPPTHVAHDAFGCNGADIVAMRQQMQHMQQQIQQLFYTQQHALLTRPTSLASMSYNEAVYSHYGYAPSHTGSRGQFHR